MAKSEKNGNSYGSKKKNGNGKESFFKDSIPVEGQGLDKSKTVKLYRD